MDKVTAINVYGTLVHHGAMCPCDGCQEARERWVAEQPPLLSLLDSRDAEDE